MTVLNNRDLNQVSWELRAMAGQAHVPSTQDTPRRALRPVGGADRSEGLRIERPEQVAGAWEEALRADPTPDG